MYNINIEQVFAEVKSNHNGLTSHEHAKRLKENGKNILKEKKPKTLFTRILDQIRNTLIIVLLFACLASIVVAIIESSASELIDAGVILLIVGVNVVIGVYQEQKAEKAVNGLKNMTKPFAKVIRNGKIIKAKTEELVVGDIVVLEAGDIVPADLRLFDVASLKIEDAAITGESMPSTKTTLAINKKNIPLGDRKNMAYMGSVVTYGRGTGVVVDTGMNTEMGKIADMLQGEEDAVTPLNKRINKTIKILTYAVLVVCAVVIVSDMLRGRPFTESFMVAIALAVCVIPEGLVACITLTMSLGVERMSKNKAIVRRMGSVETIGSTQVICSDKTGTLTLNKMTVKEFFILNKDEYINDDSNPNFMSLINCMTLCNDAKISIDKDKNIVFIGDPTETALIEFAYNKDFNKDNIEIMFPRINEIPFDSERKLMTTINKVGDNSIAYVKGAVDNIIERCTHILQNGKKRKLTAQDKKMILDKNFEYGSKAMRVLGYAFKEIENKDMILSKSTETDLTFIGLTGMIDPPREEVKQAIKVCKKAGIGVIMITGDHKDTAFAIAKEIGIANNINQVITGADLNLISDEELEKHITKYKVFARVNPEHKVRIVTMYKKIQKIVAMTGDGVNDAPSIKKADIGIGMGITGTDVTKEVADIILTDDNFATIVSAVKEGRKIYDNILKNIIYLVSTGMAELLMLFVVIVIVGQEFFAPALILWLNVIGDTVPALALGTEKSEKNIMNKPPENHNKHLFSGITGAHLVFYSAIQSIIILCVYFICFYAMDMPSFEAITMCFITLIIMESFQSYNLKSMNGSLFSGNPLSNKLLNYGMLVSVGLTFLLVQLPLGPIHTALKIQPLSLMQWLIATAIGFMVIPIVEIYKCFVRAHEKKKNEKYNLQ